MEEHPYATYLNGRDPVAILAETSQALHTLLDGLSPEEIANRPGPTKWSLHELMAHLADCELVWCWRIRETLGTPNPSLQAFDQDRWADRYTAYTFPQAQATFDTLRAWNLSLLTTVTAEDRARPAQHAEQGSITLGSVLGTVAGHDLHHLRLLEGLLKRDGKETVPSPS